MEIDQTNQNLEVFFDAASHHKYQATQFSPVDAT
jgi:hypothetical protein